MSYIIRSSLKKVILKQFSYQKIKYFTDSGVATGRCDISTCSNLNIAFNDQLKKNTNYANDSNFDFFCSVCGYKFNGVLESNEFTMVL